MGLPKIDRTLAIYLAKRIVLLVVAYFIAITIVFLLPRIIPGNPLATKMQQIISMYIYRPEMVGQVYRELINIFQFDKPWYIQYINFFE